MFEKVYPRPRVDLLNAINDMIELLKAKITYSDTPHGKISFRIDYYGFLYESRFTVTGIDQNSARLRLDLTGPERGRQDMLDRQAALLDSWLGKARAAA